mmetsp:Transcript_16730/g.36484  ORF Transcript_16730/g.36484 Transcript_16730/m.36484 type:complete len:200 (+) Transcript_16730:236-835(+)
MSPIGNSWGHHSMHRSVLVRCRTTSFLLVFLLVLGVFGFGVRRPTRLCLVRIPMQALSRSSTQERFVTGRVWQQRCKHCSRMRTASVTSLGLVDNCGSSNFRRQVYRTGKNRSVFTGASACWWLLLVVLLLLLLLLLLVVLLLVVLVVAVLVSDPADTPEARLPPEEAFPAVMRSRKSLPKASNATHSGFSTSLLRCDT